MLISFKLICISGFPSIYFALQQFIGSIDGGYGLKPIWRGFGM
jgi:hypothetical protein